MMRGEADLGSARSVPRGENVARLASRIRSFVRGMGSIIVLVPPAWETAAPLLRPQPPVAEALRSHWLRVGGYLQGAIDQVAVEQEQPPAQT